MSDIEFMSQALALADRAEQLQEVPVGALVVRNGEVIGRGWNSPITGCDPTAHAEIMALRAAAQTLGNYRLTGCDLYVTIEPCTMCAGAIVHSRIRRLVFGALEPKAGVVVSNSRILDGEQLNHRVEYVGEIMAAECSEKVSAFFRRRRKEKRAEREAKRASKKPD